MSVNKPESFQALFLRAAQRKGGKRELEFLLDIDYFDGNASEHNVALFSDDRILAAFTKQIFKSGFVWHP